MRNITSHRDGHGLAELLTITADSLDLSNGLASHRYSVTYGLDDSPIGVAAIQFQKGPRNEVGSTPGIIDSVLLAIIEDRMACFQEGAYPSRESALVRTKVQEAMHWLRHRADERASRGVLGKREK